ncbi:integrase arm-type DNA-binding domain-containing protein [Novosphingobium sp. BL-8H]|uniref:tyrosine-type recombinase/integrase n=1 Tax=Novosphingobium sp. BL-8H TaxID=3127640 RepID=UPI0037583BA3
MTRNPSFTPTSLDAIKSGTIKDPSTPGLSIEVLPSGKKTWRYVRRVSGRATLVRLRLGAYPALSIAEARTQASTLNEMSEQGIDPRVAMQVEIDRTSMTVDRAHQLYIAAVRHGRAGSPKSVVREQTIIDKIKLHRMVSPSIGNISIHEVTESDLIKIVSKKALVGKMMANRLASEIMCFFKWCAGLRGLEVGLETDPARRLKDLKFPQSPRKRTLDLDEIGWYLRGVAEEDSLNRRRCMLLWLLTATRYREVLGARSEEVKNGVWTIPAHRAKNDHAHAIKLGPWGLSLIKSESVWVIPSPIFDGPWRHGWYSARDRVLGRMSQYAGREIEHFTPHDLRRTVRSNTKRLKVDFETAEAMLNHLKSGMERVYDNYDLEAEKAAWFLKWENEIIRIAHLAGVARQLGVPEGPHAQTE